MQFRLWMIVGDALPARRWWGNPGFSPARLRAGGAWRRGALAVAGVVALAGCGLDLGLNGEGTSPATPVATAPPDPVAAFAASASPGMEDRVVLAGGQLARVRLIRAYAAASGRECREVTIGTGFGERSRLICRDGETWVEARPLLQRAAARP